MNNPAQVDVPTARALRSQALPVWARQLVGASDSVQPFAKPLAGSDACMTC